MQELMETDPAMFSRDAVLRAYREDGVPRAVEEALLALSDKYGLGYEPEAAVASHGPAKICVADEATVITRKFRSWLNKITPENRAKVSEEARAVVDGAPDDVRGDLLAILWDFMGRQKSHAEVFLEVARHIARPSFWGERLEELARGYEGTVPRDSDDYDGFCDFTKQKDWYANRWRALVRLEAVTPDDAAARLAALMAETEDVHLRTAYVGCLTELRDVLGEKGTQAVRDAMRVKGLPPMLRFKLMDVLGE